MRALIPWGDIMSSTIRTALHEAYLCSVSGEGLLITPPATGDVHLDPAQASLYASDELAILQRLDTMGWELSDDQNGEPYWVLVGRTADGREAFGLYGREPITTMPTMEEQAQAMEALCEAAGVRIAADC